MEEEVDNGKWNMEYSYAIKFTWKIDNFSTITKARHDSDIFKGGDHKWKIQIYPKGRDSNGDNLSIYPHPVDTATLPDGWLRPVKFSLSVISEVDDHTVKIESNYTFKSNCGWGFPSFMALNKLHDVDQRFLVRDTCTVRAEVWFNEEKDKEEPNIDLKSVMRSPSFTKFDTLFSDIQNETPTYFNITASEVVDAQIIYEKCLDMDLISVVRSGRALELKNALSLLLAAKEIPDSMVDETTTFIENFDQGCDLSEAQEDEYSVDELKSNLKQLASKFMPVRKQAEAAESEKCRLDKLLDENNADKARLGKRLAELAEQATTWKQALLCAEQRMNTPAVKKDEAEKAVSEFRAPWESLKALHSTWIKETAINNTETLFFGLFSEGEDS